MMFQDLKKDLREFLDLGLLDGAQRSLRRSHVSCKDSAVLKEVPGVLRGISV